MVGEFDAARAGRGRHLRRDRRQPRPRPRRLARPARHAARARMLTGVPAHVDGRMLGDHRDGRRRAHQPRPDVALHRGRRTTGTRSGRGTASGSCPGRRRCGSTRAAAGCPRRCSPASTRSARSRHSRATGHEHTWFVLTPEDHREGVRAVGLGAEPRPDRTQRAPGARPGPARAPPRRSRPSSSTARTSSSRDTLPELVAGMNALTASRCSTSATSSAQSSPATARWTTRSPRTCR